jgi:hypothetical protein
MYVYNITVMILNDNYQFPLPISSLIVLMWLTQPAAHKHSAVVVGRDKQDQSGNITSTCMVHKYIQL